ncbi:putative calcium-binding protein CML15 [Hibiscus syriacus]|uniref:Calcium-binding protein CML15 n=1 Tax=Hibiscus syriacus TaxID=106335 RepID=A0A6A3CEH7_HIBSY|nr:putative calcium-binding protein CML15 [Hibiscus syriacus]
MEVLWLFDRDGKGFITAVELAGCMAKMGHPLAHKELRELMREADFDGDGVISFSEFSSIMAKLSMDFLGVSFSTY